MWVQVDGLDYLVVDLKKLKWLSKPMHIKFYVLLFELIRQSNLTCNFVISLD